MPRRSTLLFVLTAAWFGIFWPIHLTAVAADLTAGTARIDLTPPPELQAALGGYGARMSRPSEGVHDRVWAKALVVSEGSRRCAVLTADVLGFPPTFKPLLLQQLADDGWLAEQILLLPSHTHTSIDMQAINPANLFGIKQIGVYDQQLLSWTLERIADVIRRASREQQPVLLATSAVAMPGWNRNRRQSGGPTDDTLTLTRLDTLDGRPLAVLIHFTAHPTFLGPEHMLFSGGWPGHLQRTLEALIGHDVNVLYYNGAVGDQSPVGRGDTGPSRWEAAERFGQELAVAGHHLWATITPRRLDTLAMHLQSIELPGNRWHPDFMQTGGAEYGLSEQLLDRVLPLMFPRTTTSASLRLGNLVIVGVPGEMTAELGLQLKQQVRDVTGAEHVTIGGLANEWISYILSPEQYRQGGYEASVSFYGEELGPCVVQGAVAGATALGPAVSSDGK